MDPNNSQGFASRKALDYWRDVDLYIGGTEHAVGHLMYSRFWHKVLFDRGHVSTNEPFQKLVNQGMILGETEFTAYKSNAGNLVSSVDVHRNEERQLVHRSTGEAMNETRVGPDEVEKQGNAFVLIDQPEIRVDSRAHKMSKSRGNVVNPDDIVQDYGADSLRLYEMFMGPLEVSKPWSMAGVNGRPMRSQSVRRTYSGPVSNSLESRMTGV